VGGLPGRRPAGRERALADALDLQFRRYDTAGLQPALAALRALDTAQGPMRELATPVRDGLGALVQLAAAQREFAGNQQSYQWVFISCGAGIALGVLLSSAIGVWLVRGTSRPPGQALAPAKGVATGDLTQAIEVTSRDEMGQLMQALEDMNAILVNIVTEVRTGADTIASASTQIASGNLEPAARTEQQARSLERTAGSMAELTGTVKHNAASAGQASTGIESASQVALRGGAAVQRVVTAMGSINDSSKRIADIVGVIDRIAFRPISSP
jgi:methyl-accepting chemotaxis protein-1 (serine sensor receptor)